MTFEPVPTATSIVDDPGCYSCARLRLRFGHHQNRGRAVLKRPLTSSCGRGFRFTPALRLWQSCCGGTENQTIEGMGEWKLRLDRTRRSGNAELFHSAAQRTGMEGENLRRAVGAIDDPSPVDGLFPTQPNHRIDASPVPEKNGVSRRRFRLRFEP